MREETVTNTVDVERWFLRRGASPLIEDTRYTRGLRVRSARALVILFLLVMLAFVPGSTGEWPLTTAIAVGAILLSWVGGNLLRRRRPFARPEEIGWFEIAVFLLVPTLTLLISPYADTILDDVLINGGDNKPLTALAALVVQTTLLVLVLWTVRSGLVSITIFLAREVWRSMLTSGIALARTLPVLLGVVFFFFFTAEIWQSVGRLDSWAYATVTIAFIVLSGVFLFTGGSIDVRRLATFESPEDLREALRHTPFHGRDGSSAPVVCPLDARQERSLRLIATTSRLVIAQIIAAATFVFFLAFAVLTVNAESIKTWAAADANVILAWETTRHAYAFTWEQVRVSGFLAFFSGFYYAVVSATDASLREGVRDTAADTVREACAARIEALRDTPSAA